MLECVFFIFAVGMGNPSPGKAAMNESLTTLFSTQDDVTPKEWMVINDSVMGGISESSVATTQSGALLFTGNVSLENNGGFASIRRIPRAYGLSDHQGLEIRVKGDGNTYQLRLRTSDGWDGVAYRARFATSGDGWETLRLPFDSFVPSFRGRVVRGAPPLDPKDIRQVGFLISDKQQGEFRLEVEGVWGYRESPEDD